MAAMMAQRRQNSCHISFMIRLPIFPCMFLVVLHWRMFLCSLTTIGGGGDAGRE